MTEPAIAPPPSPGISPVSLPPLDALAPRLAARLDRDGFACIEGAISTDWLDRARAAIALAIGEHGAKFFSLIRPSRDVRFPFGEVARDPELRDLANRLVRHACPPAPGADGFYDVVRVVAGGNGSHGSGEFHYDASVITLLVPIHIPEGPAGHTGELVVFPNRRTIGRSLAANLAEKAALQNRFAWARAARRVASGSGYEIKTLVPGNIYRFWGYRSYHGNLACAPGQLRATLLLHAGDPHRDGLTMRAIRALRQLTEARRRRP